jgi:type I restriction enzyme S subunit
MSNIQISEEQLDTVLKILQHNLTPDITVWVYGSRASGTAKLYSDLDLALERNDGKAINNEQIVNLMDEFEESNLPYKVDVMDYLNAKGIFKQNVDQQRIKLLY